MAQSNDIVIVSGARTPMGRYCGKLRGFTAQELGAIAGRAAIERSGLEAAEFDHCVFGNAQQTSGDALYGARHVGLRAGLAETTPALTVNRLCGSGMQAIITGAQMIQLGEARVVLAGGMEAMSQAPHVIRGMRWGVGLGEGKLEDSLMVALLDSYCGLYMANTAELYAGQMGIDRGAQDEFALRSQQLAAAVVLMGAAEAGWRRLRPLGRIVSWGIAGVEPRLMGRGPVPATRRALEKAGLALGEIDLIEVNEAFAAQYLAVEKELGLDRELVNVNGGAIALGHPLGATGTRLVLTLLYELRRRGGRYGLATACIGGGQGIAMIVESLG